MRQTELAGSKDAVGHVLTLKRTGRAIENTDLYRGCALFEPPRQTALGLIFLLGSLTDGKICSFFLEYRLWSLS